MKLPGLDLQKAIAAALMADETLRTIFAGNPRVYDRVPADPSTGLITAEFPYIELAEPDTVESADTCEDGAETHFPVHVWSRAVGKVEAQTIANAVAQALDVTLDLSASVDRHRVVVHQVKQARGIPVPDKLSAHWLVLMRYVTAAPRAPGS